MALRWLVRAALLWLLAVPAAGPSAAQGPFSGPNPDLPFTVNAERFEYEHARDLYTASGGVRVVQDGGGTLTADWMVLNYTTRVGVAVGNVVIRDAGDLVETDFARVNLETLEVLAREARIDSEDPALIVEGSWLSRTGTNAYGIEDALFTTCRCPPGRSARPWEITASQADVTIGGYAKARNVVFRALGVPVLYAPFALFPVKSERESGFLVPSLGRSQRSGLQVDLPFFWAARENLNVLLRPQWIAERGAKANGEIEYVFGETGWGEGSFGLLLNDGKIRPGDPTTRFSDDRHAFTLRHEQPLGEGARFGLDLKRVSDNQYVLDFDDFSANERSSRFLESTAWLSTARAGLYGTIETSLLDDLQSPNDLDRDEHFLQRLPDVQLAMLPRRVWGPFETSASLRYTYFYQREDTKTLRGRRPFDGRFFDTGRDGLFDPDEPNSKGRFPGPGDLADNDNDNGTGRRRGENDGLFQEGELIADSGHRLDFYPKLTLPGRVGLFETISELGFRETAYFAREGGSDSRGLFTARFDARTRFQRSFQLGRVALWHRVEPRVGFAMISGAGDPDDGTLFIPGSSVRSERLIDSDPRLLLRDPTDRIDDERFLNFSVSNLLYGPPLAAGLPPREVAELRVGSGYDFVEGRQSNVFIDARFQPNPYLGFSSELGYDPKQTKLDEVAASLSLQGTVPAGLPRSQLARTNQAALSYRFLRDGVNPFEGFQREDDVFDGPNTDFTRVDQVGLQANYVISRRFDLFASGYQSFDDSQVRGGGFGLNFFSGCGCWEMSLRLDSSSRPDDTRLGIEFRLEGFGIGVRRELGSSREEN